MAKKADSFSINTRGRGGGYEANKDGNRGDFKRYNLREARNDDPMSDDNKGAYIGLYKVEQGTEDNELVLLDDLNPQDPNVVWEDAVLFEGLQVGNVGFNDIPTDDDPKGNIFCPIADMMRANPHVPKEKFISWPKYGIVLTGIDGNEYEIKKGERKGEMSGDSKKLVHVGHRYINNIMRDIIKLCKRMGFTTLRGTVWSISRAECDQDKGIFTPRIGDRWDLVKQLSEDELLDRYAEAAEDRGYDSVERYCAPIDYPVVLEPPSVEEREEIAQIILNAVGPEKGRSSSRSSGGASRSRSPRSARTSQGSRRRGSEGGDRGETSQGGRGRRAVNRSGGRASARTRDYTQDEAAPPKVADGDGYFEPADDDVPF